MDEFLVMTWIRKGWLGKIKNWNFGILKVKIMTKCQAYSLVEIKY